MLRSNSKQSGESMQSVLKKKRKGFGGKDLQKTKEGFNADCLFSLVVAQM